MSTNTSKAFDEIEMNDADRSFEFEPTIKLVVKAECLQSIENLKKPKAKPTLIKGQLTVSF